MTKCTLTCLRNVSSTIRHALSSIPFWKLMHSSKKDTSHRANIPFARVKKNQRRTGKKGKTNEIYKTYRTYTHANCTIATDNAQVYACAQYNNIHTEWSSHCHAWARTHTMASNVLGSTIFLFPRAVCNVHAFDTSYLVRVEQCIRISELYVNLVNNHETFLFQKWIEFHLIGAIKSTVT